MDIMSQFGHQLTLEKHEKAQKRLEDAFGPGALVGAQGIVKRYLRDFSDHLQNALQEEAQGQVRQFIRVIRELDPDLIALCTFQSVLHSIATEGEFLVSCLLVGTSISDELWVAGLTKHNAKLAKKIERAVRKRHSRAKERKQAMRSIAKRAGFEMRRWSKENTVQAGGWLISHLLEALPDVFVKVTEPRKTCLTITESAQEIAFDAVAYALAHRAPYLPCLTSPVPWTGVHRGGHPDPRTEGAPLIRTFHDETIGAARAAIRSGQMQPALDAINALQGVAWTINEPIFEVLRACYEQDIHVEGLPRPKDYAMPPHPRPWDDMTEAERRLWRYRASEVKAENRSLVSERVLFAEDMQTADLLIGEGRFWTPINCDWRGRVYPLPHFNFTRDDRVRAMFLFADGAPIGEDGLWWLKVHLANCGDFDKISKKPMEERVAWVDANVAVIQAIAENPLAEAQRAVWTKADKPFLFLAACMELAAVLAGGVSTVTRLPVSWDGSCSGLQHLCAMTRATEGSLVNLTASDEPQDIYQTIADRVLPRIAEDAANGDPVAKCWNDFLLDANSRKVVKRNVMTYAYSSKRYGMAKQHDSDTLAPLEFEVLAGVRDEHPFEVYAEARTDGPPSIAGRYLANHVFREIVEAVPKPAEAMTFLQRCARTLAHEGKPLTWVTPAGLPWSNRYHVPHVKQVQLWCHDTRVTLKVTVGDHKEIDKDKAANGVAPNFVHALDAAHLMLTVNAAVREGITAIATVHDSFGCLAPHARRFNEIIREQFVEMYETNDVLTQVREQALRDLTIHNAHRLPDVPERGPLDLKEVLSAPYAFA